AQCRLGLAGQLRLLTQLCQRLLLRLPLFAKGSDQFIQGRQLLRLGFAGLLYRCQPAQPALQCLLLLFERLLLGLLGLQGRGELLDLLFQLAKLGNTVPLALAEGGFGGSDLAADILQAAGGLLADTREAFLSRHQLTLQAGLLLVTPVTEPHQRNQQRQADRPQRPVALAPGRRFPQGAHPRGLGRYPIILGYADPRQVPDIMINHTIPCYYSWS